MKELSIKEKELLLKDLCARLPYGVLCHVNCDDTNTPRKLSRIEVDELDGILLDFWTDREDYLSIQVYLSEVKPYLRQISSMTEEEKKVFDDFCVIDEFAWEGNSEIGYKNQAIIMSDAIDWLNTHHFDYRGLIEKGLALEATKGMYK